MSAEGLEFDRKSIRYVLDKHHDAVGLACDCVAFANAVGGSILLGIEDDQTEPPSEQRVPDDLAEWLSKRIPQITVNVGITCQKKVASNGGEYLEIKVFPNQQSIAATSDGRYFIRVSDESHRLMPDELGRLFAEKNTFVWELQTTRRIPQHQVDLAKLGDFMRAIRESDRVSGFVKQKSDSELLEQYLFVKDGLLTNLGILWIGRREDRAGLLFAPSLQCIKYDEQERKVRKWTWDDFNLNPMEIIEAVWREIPDWQESYELPDGLFRKNVPHYDEIVVRELLANALVHRPYTQRGDVFLNLHPDRLEVHNPGLLPIGVTPRNILHTTSQRNPHLARVFYDLKLMEREGSGYDRIYEVLLSSGKAIPTVEEGDDRVVVTVQKWMINEKIVDFVAKADQVLSLTQRERITLGLLAQQQNLTAIEMAKLLELPRADDVRFWLGRLLKWNVIQSRGRTKAMEYFVAPKLLKKLDFKGATTLKGIEKHRLRELILSDLAIYERASISEIHDRIGAEIPRRRIQRVLADLVTEGSLEIEGQGRGRRYVIVPKRS